MVLIVLTRRVDHILDHVQWSRWEMARRVLTTPNVLAMVLAKVTCHFHAILKVLAPAVCNTTILTSSANPVVLIVMLAPAAPLFVVGESGVRVPRLVAAAPKPGPAHVVQPKLRVATPNRAVATALVTMVKAVLPVAQTAVSVHHLVGESPAAAVHTVVITSVIMGRPAPLAPMTVALV